ncbi:CRISPR-associated helicase Cas3' [Terriglobus sp.]|uniref:CRISPR-associated helicase Cas3' n=1 Tax=Terriglobus sp. TaxID=1889013 RepID=UPI003B00A6AE
MLYAHTLAGQDEASWELLSTHLEAVSNQAAALARAFDATEWGRVLGMSHDLGKASRNFQEYLHKSHAAREREAEDAGEAAPKSVGRVDHSTFGARYLAGLDRQAGVLLAFCVAGHHAGLPDWSSAEDADCSTLQQRLKAAHSIPHVPDPQLHLRIPRLPAFADDPRLRTGQRLDFALAFFTRMAFSTLVDADRTCTEQFADPIQAKQRAAARPGIVQLHAAIRSHVEQKQTSAKMTAVNQQRTRVQQQCIAAATNEPGFFSLQVPTGGGKTLASLLFALEHATVWKKRRVIVAIPFTSIIEQTADVYREALGNIAHGGLIEHHTNVEPERETRANKLGAENWDAPLVVTTNVQLFESMFAARTSPCRKLHNLANSVIVLDEAQTLPVELLDPTLAALRELVEHYKCSVVLCTATQPALERRDDFSIGIENVRPIVADTATLFQALRRVDVRHAGALTDAELADRLAAETRALCIVNTRPHALALFQAIAQQVPLDECFHLSTLMCGAHRRQVLQTVRERVRDASRCCRVVSTQLVEAGVDLDFPVVYRAAAGMDSIAQAAGRCNREGLLPSGITHVFDTPERRLTGFLEQARQAGSEVFAQPEFRDDPLSPAAVQEYFYQLYWKHRSQWDAKKVMECFRLDRVGGQLVFQFRQAEARYRIIQDQQVQILVPFTPEAQKFIDELSSGHVAYQPQRKLQPYLVSVPKRAHDRLVADHAVVAHPSGLSLLIRADLYDGTTGLRLDGYGLETLIG